MRKLDGDKLVKDMEARMKNLLQLVDRDFSGNTNKLYDQYFELKWWKECVERSEYDIEE